MTKPLRHTKHEIENAGKIAANLNLRVRLLPDGSIEFFPIIHSQKTKHVDESEVIEL